MNDVEERAKLVDGMQLTSQRARQVEAEAVDVHLLHPVAQAVHDQLQHARAAHVQRVAAAGEVLVVARVVRQQPVVRRVVDAAQRQRRAEVIAFGGVVVDDVEDDFEAGGVQRPHHHLELAHALERRAPTRRSAGPARSTTACCSPSSCAGPFCTRCQSSRVVMHRHQLDGGDAERSSGGGSPAPRRARGRCRAALRGCCGCSLGEALDVQLVDQRLVPRRARRPIVAPGERGIDDRGERRVRRAVAIVEGRVVAARP